MRVLVTGAYGFIGAHVVAALEQAGHEVICAVRRTHRDRRFGHLDAIPCDMASDVRVADWVPRLSGIEAVVNCAGILREHAGQTFDAVHRAAPTALFDACVQSGVRHVVQISAIGPPDKVPFIATKWAADDHLATLQLDWVVIRPSFVYSAIGSYGGNSLIRALAALPFVVPVAGDGRQLLQPIDVDDLAEVAARSLCTPGAFRQVLQAVGPERITFTDFLASWRQWLGLQPAKVLHLPRWLVTVATALGQRLGRGPLGQTMSVMLAEGNVGDSGAYDRLAAAVGYAPRRLAAVLRRIPSHVQDRWHARLYFLRPVLRISVALLWIGSGISGLLMEHSEGARILVTAGVPATAAGPLVLTTSMLDVVLGAAALARYRLMVTGTLMVLSVIGYTVFLGVTLPGLWVHPFGPLLKNLVLIPAILIMMATDDQR